MDKLSILSKVRKIYEENANIMQYLRNLEASKGNSLEDIMIAYDFQAGTYVDGYLNNPHWKDRYLMRLINIIRDLPGRKKTIFEPGVGEATTLIPFLNKLNMDVCSGGGHILVSGYGWKRIF